MDACSVLWPLSHRLALWEPDLGFAVEVTPYPFSIKPRSKRFTTSLCGTAESFHHKVWVTFYRQMKKNMKDFDRNVEYETL